MAADMSDRNLIKSSNEWCKKRVVEGGENHLRWRYRFGKNK